MASISKQPNGRKTVQFIGSDRKRRSIRLGKITMSGAESVKSKVEHLVSHNLTKHALDSATSVWVSELDTKMTEKLAGVGLIDKKETMELKDLLDYFYKKHETNRKTNT